MNRRNQRPTFQEAFASLRDSNSDSPTPSQNLPHSSNANPTFGNCNSENFDITIGTGTHFYVRPSYQEERAKLTACWRELLDSLLHAAVDSSKPMQNFCNKCQLPLQDDGIIRCNDCAFNCIFCLDCFESSHEN